MVETTVECWKAQIRELEKALRWEKAQVLMLQTQLEKIKVPRSEKPSVKEMELG